MIHRTVLIKFDETTTEEQLSEVVERFKALKDQLTGIVDLQAGINIGKSKEYQVVLMVRFEDHAALNAYVVSPEHVAVAKFIQDVGRLDSIGTDFEL
ncbi:Dabb family protein [Metabacillus fastidiosus]|uniref:Dabb family protein n=1 Tax=Metabacillus fastidiosus TaxID=1458 RepID=UPI002E1B9D2E|nr:Dabb family protein [Metabacillus fastidiosus]